MTEHVIKELPVNQKLQIMEAIWEDFRDRLERLNVPQPQQNLLDQRRARKGHDAKEESRGHALGGRYAGRMELHRSPAGCPDAHDHDPT